jgi:hypothetical protein
MPLALIFKELIGLMLISIPLYDAMEIKSLIIALCLLALSIPLGLYLESWLTIESALLTFSTILGPVVIGSALIIRAINYQIALSYMTISGVIGGQLSTGRFFLKPRLSFDILNNHCDLFYGDGNLDHRSATILRIKKSRADLFLRVYPDKWEVKGVRRLFSKVPDVQIGDDQFDKYFIAESFNEAFVKAVFSGDALIYTKKLMKKICEIKIDSDHCFFSIGGIWPNKDEYGYLVDLAIACMNNISSYQKKGYGDRREG